MGWSKKCRDVNWETAVNPFSSCLLMVLSLAVGLRVVDLRRGGINIEELQTINLNVFQFTADDLMLFTFAIFQDLGLLSEFHIKPEVWCFVCCAVWCVL